MLTRCSIGFPTLHLAQNTFEPMFSYSDRLFFEGIDHNMLLYARRTSFDKIQDKWMNFSVRSLIIICMTFNILKYFATVCFFVNVFQMAVHVTFTFCHKRLYIQQTIFRLMWKSIVYRRTSITKIPCLSSGGIPAVWAPSQQKLMWSHSRFFHAGFARTESCSRARGPAPGPLDFQTYV